MTETKKCWNCHGTGYWFPNSWDFKEPCYVCESTGLGEVADLRKQIMDLDERIQGGQVTPETVEQFTVAMNKFRSLTTGEAV